MLITIPPKDITATSVVPPPISTIIFPLGSSISISAPTAADIGSSIKYTSLAPARITASSTALSSTSVIPDGTPTKTLGLIALYLLHTLSNKFFNNNFVAVKSAITPSFKGFMAFISLGVLPTISFASKPVAIIFPFFVSTDITDGSLNTIPFPFIVTNIFAVPKSIPISLDLNDKKFIILLSFRFKIISSIYYFFQKRC